MCLNIERADCISFNPPIWPIYLVLVLLISTSEAFAGSVNESDSANVCKIERIEYSVLD